MKEFWKDYNDMCIKPSMKWLAKHWKGYILMLITAFPLGYAIGYCVMNKDDIKDRIESKFNKEES